MCTLRSWILVAVCLVLLPGGPAWAQEGDLVALQPKLRIGDTPLNGAVRMQLRIFSSPTSSQILFEDSAMVAVAGGMYSTVLGDQPSRGSITSAIAGEAAYLEVVVDGTALPRRPISPATLRAARRAVVRGGPVAIAVVSQDALEADLGALRGLQDPPPAAPEPSVEPGEPIQMPGDILDVTGPLRIRSGAPGEGKVLMSDAEGMARWEPLPPPTAVPATSPEDYQFAPVFGPKLDQPLVLQVGGRRALRIEPGIQAPNLIGGAEANTVPPRIEGATIAGGGTRQEPNRVDQAFGAIGGGSANRVKGPFAVVAGGWQNEAGGPRSAVGGGRENRAGGVASVVAGGFTNTASGSYASIAGGWGNRADGYVSTLAGGWGNTATGLVSTIGGGQQNRALGGGATVSGGWKNQASGLGAAVPGGKENLAAGDFSVAMGLGAQALHPGTFVWNDATDSPFASTGGNQFLIRAAGNVGIDVDHPTEKLTVAGAVRADRFLGDGSGLTGIPFRAVTIPANAIRGDLIAPAAIHLDHLAKGVADLVSRETIERDQPSAHRVLAGTSSPSLVGGHPENQIGAGARGAVIAGGGETDAPNIAREDYSVVSGGMGNEAGRPYAAIGGGYDNQATGTHSVVPGGAHNAAVGDFSLAAGRRAKALHAGSFVWGDSTDADLRSGRANQWLVRASGGVDIRTDAALSSGATLAPGSGSWSSQSDRSTKENLAPVDAREILARVIELPVWTWNYRTQPTEIRHLGPVAQDFRAAFGLGETDTHISVVDAQGIAFSAIQGLHDMVEQKSKQIARLERENQRLADRLGAMEQQLQQLQERWTAPP